MTGAEPVRIRLLDGFGVSVGPRTIERSAWRLKKAAGLVKLLALAPGHRLHREQAMDLLWPDLSTKAASNNLRQTLHAARRTLSPDPARGSRYLVSQDETLLLCPGGSLWVDIQAFEEAALSARRSRDPAAYRAALDLYAGELLPENRYEEWTEARRENLRQLYLALLGELAGLYEEHGEHELAIEALQEATAEEPTLQEAHAALMRLHALFGRPEQALAQYERLRDALSRGLGTRPGAATRRLRDEIAAGRLPSSSTSVPPRDEPPTAGEHNLPTPRTSFVGRRREMVEIKRTLAMTRLLTLTGAGGSGKTRLALEVARELVGAYPDGMWLVELASLSEPELVPQTVARAAGVPEQSGRPLVETLVEALRIKSMLLVLDNCEHLVDACARFADTLLDACPRVRVLATSREALDVEGEIRHPVPPLSVPDPGRAPRIAELEGHESVRLFVERARRRDPAFALTTQNAHAVVEVCRRLDGIPLAVELAAARVGTLTVGQIARRLEDSSPMLLTGGGRTAAPRQRTLRGALDWSHELLGEQERTLFGRLSVFAGGWTLEAAEAVGKGGSIEEGEVLDLLGRLVDKSLVVAEASGEDAPRYRMLETVRQYASGKLRSGGEEKAVGQRHALYFLDLTERAEPELSGARQAAWLDRLERELDNSRAALEWFRQSEQGQAHLRLAGALWWFCYLRGHYDGGRGWLEGALAGGGGASPPARAKALNGAGFLALLQCDYDAARGQLEEALALYRALGDERGVASSSQILGSIARERGDYGRAEALHEESLALWRKLGDEVGEARSLNYLAYVAWLQRKHRRARELCEQTLLRFRRLGDGEGIAWALISLGSSAHYAGDLRRARALLEESLALSGEVGYKEGVAWSLNQLGVLAYREGDHRRATELLAESLEIHQDLGDRWRAASVLEALAETFCARGQPEPAARLFGAAGAVREAISVPIPLCERIDHDEHLSATRSRLGAAAFAAAWAEGRAMTQQEAVQYALETNEPASPEATTPARQPSRGLTRREKEVAALVARGLTNRQIASELTISERTVDAHVAKIFKKLRLCSRSQLSAWVTGRGLPSSSSG